MSAGRFAPGAAAGVLLFLIALVSGADLALALAIGAGGGFVVGAIYAARRRPEQLLPVACIAGAGALFASEFMITFQLSSTGLDFCNVQAMPRHHFALGVLAIFAVIAVVIAVASASKPAAISVGIAGVIALVLFLTIDLPHANNTGTLAGCSPSTAGNFFDAKAVPQAGFWLEMVGALALALSGVALATLNPDQLRELRPKWLRRGKSGDDPGPEGPGGGSITSSDDKPPTGTAKEREAHADRRAHTSRRARARRRS